MSEWPAFNAIGRISSALALLSPAMKVSPHVIAAHVFLNVCLKPMSFSIM